MKIRNAIAYTTAALVFFSVYMFDVFNSILRGQSHSKSPVLYGTFLSTCDKTSFVQRVLRVPQNYVKNSVCGIDYGFISGDIKFECSRSCNVAPTLKNYVEQCSGPIISPKERFDKCGTGSSCASLLSNCYLHICAAATMEARNGKKCLKKPTRNGTHVLKELYSIPQTSIVLQELGVKRNLNDILRISMAYLNDERGLPKDADDYTKIGSLKTAAEIACSFASVTAIPFYENLSPIVTKVNLKNKIHNILSTKFIGLTYCNKKHPGLDLLMESAIIHSFPLTIIGWEDEHPSTQAKLIRTLQFLEYGDVADDTIIVFIDAFDSIVLRNPEVFINEFRIFNKSIVFGGEDLCFPLGSPIFNFGENLCEKYYPPSKGSKSHPNRYVNTGQWVAYAASMKAFLKDYMRLVGPDVGAVFPGTDQNAIGMMIMSGAWEEVVTIDYQAKLFIVAVNYKNEELMTRNGEPAAAVVHFNGKSKMRGRKWAAEEYLFKACALRTSNSSTASRETSSDHKITVVTFQST